MIYLNNIKKIIDGNIILDNLTLSIQKGEFVGIIGHSGSGKTTLLNVIGLIDDYTQGNYVLDGIVLDYLNFTKRTSIQKKYFSYIFQDYHLINNLNIMDNITLPLGYAGISFNERMRKGKLLLEKLNLTDKAHDFPKSLSGGEKQRVAIARALISEPQIILADEPTGALDSDNTENIMKHLKQVHDRDITIIMVTHNLELSKNFDRIITMKDGTIL